MTNLEQEAHTARIMVEAEGGRAFVMIATMKPLPNEPLARDVRIVRAVTEGTKREDGEAWLDVLEREHARVSGMIGLRTVLSRKGPAR